jgi:hypothetical protein
MPAPPLKQHHARRHRYVQRGDGAGHGNAHQHVAMLLHQLVQTAAFAAQNEDRRPRIVGFAVQLGAALVESINPEAALL